MDKEIIDVIIKNLILNMLIYVMFFKINGEKINKKFIIISCIAQTAFYTCMRIMLNSNTFLVVILSYIFQIALLKIHNRGNKKSVIASALISNASVYTLFIVVSFIEVFLKIIMNIRYQIIDLSLTLIIEVLLLAGILNIKKIKNGISFLKDPLGNEYLCIIMIVISVIAIFAYCLFGSSEKYFGSNIFIVIVTSLIMIIIMIQKTLTLYYKQKLLAKNIEDYKSEIALKDAQIKSLSDEKYKISKLNHEFYNRQKSLIHKVEEITSMNTEIADELDLSKQINDLTKEYTDKAQEIKTLDKLPTTGIVEIDDMFKYMQSECDSKKIQFNLKIIGNIYHMINNKIPQSRLVTLIGDHLRDAIIAIDFSNNTFKSILAVLGENNGVYEFCVFDTGIEFKIDTLLNLGLKPATTHKDSGGTGIGFMTTFETMKETKASLIIDEMREMSNTDYTKSVTIRFDGKNEYRIKSYRSDEIKKKMKDNRIIIENKKGSSTQWN